MNVFQRSLGWLRDALDLEELTLPNQLDTGAVAPVIDVGTGLSYFALSDAEMSDGWNVLLDTRGVGMINTTPPPFGTPGTMANGGQSAIGEARVHSMSVYSAAGGSQFRLHITEPNNDGLEDGVALAYGDPGGAGSVYRWPQGEFAPLASAGGIVVPHGHRLRLRQIGANVLSVRMLVEWRPVGAGVPR